MTPRFLRVPAYAIDHVPHKQDCYPLLPVDPSGISNDQVYSVRLRDAFQSVDAAFVCERGYIQRAMQYATCGMIIPCPGRDPILLLWGISGVRRPDLGHISCLPCAPAKQLAFDFVPEPSPKFYAVQPQTAEEKTHIEALPDATVYKYKNYVAVPANTAETLVQSVKTIMPLEAIVTSKHHDRTITVQMHKTHTTSDLPAILSAHKTIRGIYLTSKSAARVLFTSKQAAEEAIPTILSTPAVNGVTIGCTTFKPSNSRRDMQKATQDEKKAQKAMNHDQHLRQLVIRQLDGMPILPSTAQHIAAFLNLTKVRMEEGSIFGETDKAAELHETVIGGKWFIGCRAFV